LSASPLQRGCQPRGKLLRQCALCALNTVAWVFRPQFDPIGDEKSTARDPERAQAASGVDNLANL
jgi:hypothetical protein